MPSVESVKAVFDIIAGPLGVLFVLAFIVFALFRWVFPWRERSWKERLAKLETDGAERETRLRAERDDQRDRVRQCYHEKVVSEDALREEIRKLDTELRELSGKYQNLKGRFGRGPNETLT